MSQKHFEHQRGWMHRKLDELVDAAIEAGQKYEEAIQALPDFVLNELCVFEALCVLQHDGIVEESPGGLWRLKQTEQARRRADEILLKSKESEVPVRRVGRPSRPRKDKLEVLQRWLESGLSRRAFARQEGIPESTFNGWCEAEVITKSEPIDQVPE